MAHLTMTKGLDIPITGRPEGAPKPLTSAFNAPRFISLNLTPFEEMKFKVLSRIDDNVKLGQPLVEDKNTPGRYFVSPAGGVVREIRRGLKRRLLDIVIEVSHEEAIEQHPQIELHSLSRKELIERLKLGGLFTHIRQRPFNFLADPESMPKSIFIKALESAPFTPPAEFQVMGYEKEFEIGLETLKKLADGKPIHLVHRRGTSLSAFTEAKGVQKHTAEGPHPIAHPSVHIQQIDPIHTVDDVIWTLDAHAVVAIGHFVRHGQYFVPRVISIAGPGIIEGSTGYFKVREGFPLSVLLTGRVKQGPMRLISGNPLTGEQVESEDFLGYFDTVVCVIPENVKREFLHFFRLGTQKYTFSGTYLSGHLHAHDRHYDFTTNQHGEHRPFIDNSLYDQVMPLPISTMHLVKALLAEDYDLAIQLGLLEVDTEDFDLSSFVCPSKIDMMHIVKKGLHRCAMELKF